MKEKYLQAKEAYKQTIENWNTLIEKNVKLPDFAWNRLAEEMEIARINYEKAWNEYLYKELLA